MTKAAIPTTNRIVHAAVELCGLGLATIPVEPKTKESLVMGFQNWRRAPSARSIERWWQKWPEAGLGIPTGQLNRLTVVDIDDHGLIHDALIRFGQTPLQVSTPSGGRHLYYKHAGERNAEGVHDCKIDIRGQGGYVIVPPTARPDGKIYKLIAGGWNCITRLPAIPEIERSYLGKAKGKIPEGQRDNALFRHCLGQAPACDDYEALFDVANTFNYDCEPPLPARQVEKTALSVWKYVVDGNNWVGTRGITHIDSDIRDDLQPYPNAFVLFDQLKSSHEGRHPQFAIAAQAMARDGVLAGWSEKAINKARRRLVDMGFLELLHKGGKKRGDASQYAFTGKGVRNGHEYN